MRILVFSQTFYPVIGGMESNTETLITALQELGHHVSLLTESKLNGKPELSVSYPIVRNKSFFEFQRLLVKTDLLIVNGDISVPACFAAFLNRIPYIIIYQMAGKIVPRKKGFLHFGMHKLRLFLGEQAAYHLGVSKACLLSKNVFKKREGVLYNPISKNLFLLANDTQYYHAAKQYEILFAGRMIDGKGVNILTSALAILNNKGVVLRVLFSGEGPDKDKVMATAKTFTSVQVTFQPFVKDAKLADTFASSKVMVLASTTHQEGSPLSIVEAFAFGIPVIVSDQPVLLELIETDAGLSHKSGDATDLSSSIELLLNDTHYASFSLAAKQKANNYTYEKYISKWADVLNELTETFTQS